MTTFDIIVMWSARVVVMVSVLYAIYHYVQAAGRCRDNGNRIGAYGYLFLTALASIVAIGLIPEWMGIIEWNQLGKFIHEGPQP